MTCALKGHTTSCILANYIMIACMTATFDCICTEMNILGKYLNIPSLVTGVCFKLKQPVLDSTKTHDPTEGL